MHNPINILLAILCLSNAIYKMNDVPSFVNIVTATNFVPLLNCFYYQFIPLYGLLSMYQYTCVIAVDRTLLLIFPLWRVFIWGWDKNTDFIPGIEIWIRNYILRLFVQFVSFTRLFWYLGPTHSHCNIRPGIYFSCSTWLVCLKGNVSFCYIFNVLVLIDL